MVKIILDQKLKQLSICQALLAVIITASLMICQIVLTQLFRLIRRLYCPACNSRSFGEKWYYPRSQKLAKYDLKIEWKVRRYICKNCPKSFNIFTNTWFHRKKPHPLIVIVDLVKSVISAIVSKVPLIIKIEWITNEVSVTIPQQKHPSDAFATFSMYFMDTCLDEKQRRLYSGLLVLLYGNISKVHSMTSKARKTIQRGLTELQNKLPSNSISKPIRLPGAGRPRLDANPQYYSILEALLEEETSGDPMKVIKYRYTSLRLLSKTLETEFDLPASPNSIRQMLIDMKYSLKSNKPSISKKLVDDDVREQQFQIIFDKKKLFLSKQLPVISVDAKKKEQIANFKMPGRTWRKDFIKTLDHEFPNQAEGSLVPFGVYNLLTNTAFINCGTEHNTSEFSVESIAEWWNTIGKIEHESTSEVLIYADCGPSSGPRTNLWKWFLQTRVVDRFGLTVHVCNFPPGTSKWNFIEHRVFSYITKNWQGEPLTSYEKAIKFIRNTTTEKGLTIEARLDEGNYKTGLQVDAIEMASLNITYDDILGQWNYIIRPRDEDTKQEVIIAMKEKQERLAKHRKKAKSKKKILKDGKEPEFWLELYKSKFPPGQLQHDVAVLILDHKPSDFGYPESKEWSVRSLSKICSKQFNTKSSSRSQVHRLLDEICWFSHS